jgi:hypothetical protein
LREILTALAEARCLIRLLLTSLEGLQTAKKLPPYLGSLRTSLALDIADLSARFLGVNITDLSARLPEGVNMEAITTLLEHATTKPVDEESLWSAVYEAVYRTSNPPATLLKESRSTASSSGLPLDLHSHWNREFFGDSLIGLKEQMQDCLKDERPFYAKTLVFVQSSGMGKSRLADTFGRTCPMISFTLRESLNGYPPRDEEILSFTRKQLSSDDYEKIILSPSKKPLLGRPTTTEFSKRRASVIWNHCVAVGLLQASLQNVSFAPLYIFVFALT